MHTSRRFFSKSGMAYRILRNSIRRNSPCDFAIQKFVLCVVLLGFPGTLVVEMIRAHKAFRWAFFLECTLCLFSVIVLSLGSYYITSHSESTCPLTAPRLWSVSYWSVAVTWTVVLVAACVMLITSTVALFGPTRPAHSHSDHLKTDVKTYYGTL